MHHARALRDLRSSAGRPPHEPTVELAQVAGVDGAARGAARSRLRAAFTLFEVAVSAALVAGAATVVFMVIPIGLRAQHQARFQLYAGCKVLEMIDTFANHDRVYSSHQIEAQRHGQNTMPMKYAVDFDRMMNGMQLGLLPLPDTIARRLDSDGDEIARVLDDGGRLYYASPAAYEVGYHLRSGGYNHYDGYDASKLAFERVPPPDAQTILFAVSGFAQQNALPSHPCLSWPYNSYYPSSPANGGRDNDADPLTPASFSVWSGGWEYDMWAVQNSLNVSVAAQDHFKAMCQLVPSWSYSGENRWFRPGAPAEKVGRSFTQRADRPIGKYIEHAQALCAEFGIPMSGAAPYLVPELPPDLTSIPKPWVRGDTRVYPNPAHVSAIRWLAAGAIIRTSWWTKGVWPVTAADEKYARDMQECCMQWARRYASTNPYDWGAPRPLNRCSAWDHPLLQFDLFAREKVGGGGLDDADKTFRILAPTKPTNYPRGYAMWGPWGFVPPNRPFIDASFKTTTTPSGQIEIDHTNFNLTTPFAPAERCRQIVCWSADWRSYDDFESAPSGGHDASMTFLDSRGEYVDNEVVQHPADLSLSWTDATRSTRVPWVAGQDPMSRTATRRSPAYRKRFFGLWGVDRNGNGVFDQGPLPPSTRIRALPIGRWNFYDRRLISALRN